MACVRFTKLRWLSLKKRSFTDILFVAKKTRIFTCGVGKINLWRRKYELSGFFNKEISYLTRFEWDLCRPVCFKVPLAFKKSIFLILKIKSLTLLGGKNLLCVNKYFI